jgi:hypothetical protein
MHGGHGARVGDGLGVAKASIAKILRARLRSHNGSVLAASGATLVVVAIGWVLLYVAVYWVVMFILTVGKAGDAQLPASFHWVFAVGVGILMIGGAIDLWLFPGDRPVDERPALETITDVFLFLPRLTLTIGLNFAAWARLPRVLQEDAADLVERMRTERRIALSTLPLDLPVERERDRILHTLLLLQVVEIRRERGELWLRLSPLAPAGLRNPSLPDHADGDVSRMRSAAAFKHKNALPSPKRQLPGHNRKDL